VTPSWPDLERRSGLEIRAEGNRIVGHAIVFDVRSRDLGGFVEVVRPQAIDRSLTGDIVALYNHDAGQVLGRTPRTLSIRKDERGLAFELDPAPTTAGRDALELVRRGDVTGASFGFKTVKDSWSRDGDVTVRTLLDIEILELSLTALPMYQQTDVQMAQRSLQAFQAGQVLPAGRSSIRWLRMRDRTVTKF
jgi:hypothetical protein